MSENNYFNEDLIPTEFMNDLVYAIREEIGQKNKEALESYEFYANKLHLKLFEQPESISNRLIKGYESLLGEIESSNKSKNE